ncbi:hypothetical protein LUZ63_010975 [Rhynchospora breviuscula]|uniref:Uncharacterized protein n=1 Tax=Rhynchospora breviuscula TaxID=2022672 RepID=A0A9Q0CHW5_9POAL|nr:hypothetical protein LUZ63_010975 [Rhynchospora breviuscula]
MEGELEPGLKYLPFKVKAMSRESPSQKASHVVDPDLRSHWSTATNAKEWILLELHEPCLLSHIRIYNKSVLEWEISAGLRYKPEAFVKVKPRCDAPKRDILYPMNYTPCRYVRLSCLRGNPIAIFFIQLIGVSVPGLEPELQPVINYLLPHITSQRQDAQDLHLQLLQDIAGRLVPFLPQLESDLSSSTDDMESVVRFFAMLAGPFFPILSLVYERDGVKTLPSQVDSDTSKNQSSTPTLLVSSNFELLQPRRGKSPVLGHPAFSSVVYRPDTVILLLRKAFKEKQLGTVCRKVAIVLHSLSEPMQFVSGSTSDEAAKNEMAGQAHLSDYSSLFGEEYKILEGCSDATCLNLLDISSIEEGLLHVLYSSASQPLLCKKLAESNSDFLSILPLVQALLPALRPSLYGFSADQIDDTFRQWSQPSIQHALSQVVMMSSSMAYKPLLQACAGYLSSYSLAHAKAACVLIDLCSGPLSPWIPVVIAKVDLAVEALGEVLTVIQGARQSLSRSRAALKYVILAISGHMDDVLPDYKEVKNKLLFLLEMLEPFLDPAMIPMKNTIAFGGVTAMFSEKQEKNCDIALNVIRAAVKKPAVLPSLELEWRHGAVAPSALLSILDPHIPLPPEVDQCKSSANCNIDQASSSVSSDPGLKTDEPADQSFFAPTDLKQSNLTSFNLPSIETHPREISRETISRGFPDEKSIAVNFQLDNSFTTDYYNTQADYLQLVNYQECETRASEFQHLALDLCNKPDVTPEGHKAGIEALLLAAECYLNPFFLTTFRLNSELVNQINELRTKLTQKPGPDLLELSNDHANKKPNLAVLTGIENKRDKAVIDILLQAAKLESEYQLRTSPGDSLQDESVKGDGKHGSFIDISEPDMQSADAVTLVRNNQYLLCSFILRQFQIGEHSSHEILLQSLLFLLYSATELFCPPKDVIDIILQSAENLNAQLSSFYQQVIATNARRLDVERLHGFRRRWVLLEKLVMASSGDDGGKDGIRFRSLVPPSSWMEKIPEIVQYKQPLSRFLGWMAVARYAKGFLSERLFLTSDFSQLTMLLSVFTDELALMKGAPKQKIDADPFEALHPDLHLFFPSMSERFHSFGESILEAIGLQLRGLPHSAVPDILSWFSDMCLWPFFDGYLKGRVAVNAKASVLYILESVVAEHMEAIVPEMPHVAHVLVSLCKASYADVGFLESVLCVLKPLVSYFLKKATSEEELSTDPSICQDFEMIGFEELFDIICHKTESKAAQGDDTEMPLLIFTLSTLFPDLSFKRQTEILKALLCFADFKSADLYSFYSYLCAFQRVIDSCDIVLVESLRLFGIEAPFEGKPDKNDDSFLLKSSASDHNLLLLSKSSSDNKPEIEKLSTALEKLVSELIPSVEASRKLHHQLATKLARSVAQCMLLSKCLKFVVTTTSDVAIESESWFTALDGLVVFILTSQEKQCWYVASTMIDYILELPKELSLGPVVSGLCSLIKSFCLHAPTISLRLQTDKWVSGLFGSRHCFDLKGDNVVSSLADLFGVMLSHPEPEQRSIALQQLRKIVNSSSADTESIVSVLASKNWNRVVETGLTDPSTQLRKCAMVLLSKCVPYMERRELQSFLHSSDTILQGASILSQTTERGHLTRLSLLLLGNACLYSPDDDLSLIPQAVWIKLESMLTSITGGTTDMEKDLCRALCQLKTESSAKGALKEVLSTGAIVKPSDPGFTSVRETVLQALSSLASVESYFDFFLRNVDQESQELEEAEIEIELLQKEKALTDTSWQTSEGCSTHSPPLLNKKDDRKPNERLQQIKDGIRDLERSKLKEEIMVRRQKKLLFRQARQKYLEEVTSREMELLQELDREKAAESEREIDRQRQLELERAKTRELQFNLEMEREKMSQKELQHELEQVESGARPSRRDYSGSASRTRRDRDDRYRERDNGRSGQLEGSTRSSSRGHDSGPASQVGPTASSMPTVMLSGSNRSYLNQQPTMILQSRDRTDDRVSMSYEDSIERGSRDSGDANSIGESELGQAFDGYGSGHRRGGRSRHGGERRERESRREGKWERKQ